MNVMTWASLCRDYHPGDPQVLVMSANHAGVSLHSHEVYEMVYVRSGFCLHECDDQMTLLTEGDFFLIRPGQSHRYLGSRAVELYNCLFGEGCVPARLRSHPLLAASPLPRAHLDLSERKAVTRLLERILAELESRPTAWETSVESLLGQLLCEYVRVSERRGLYGDTALYAGYVTPTLAYIDRMYDQEITMSGLAREMGVSPDYLTRQFKLMAGITPLTYLRRFRIARAMELLGQGISASEAAQRVGFHSLSHFSREFKRELGISPTQFKQQEHT